MVDSGVRINLVIWIDAIQPFPRFLSLRHDLQSKVLSGLTLSELMSVRHASKALLAATKRDAVWRGLRDWFRVRNVHVYGLGQARIYGAPDKTGKTTDSKTDNKASTASSSSSAPS